MLFNKMLATKHIPMIILLLGLFGCGEGNKDNVANNEAIDYEAAFRQMECAVSRVELLLQLVQLEDQSEGRAKDERLFIYGEMVGILEVESRYSDPEMMELTCAVTNKVKRIAPNVIQEIKQENQDLRDPLDKC